VVDIHIPDVARMLGRIDQVKSQLGNIVREFRKFIRSENLCETEARQIWLDNFEDQFKATLRKISIELDDADRFIEELNASAGKRGRKVGHFQLMPEQTIAKTRKVYEKQLAEYGISWTDVADVPEE
jgi:hypothetical protein